jgi:pimeloyl-ACP methyl ester carboxylesterase
VIPYFGDVAAYVQPKPQTLKNRADVRERGLNLLRSLSDDDEYDRIVLVGHSLGSVIAYDLLSILWSERCPRTLTVSDDRALLAAIRDVEKFALLPADLPGEMKDDARHALRQAQWSLYALLRKRSGRTEKPWKISDFVTLGSPLTHAEFLAAHNLEQLYDRVRDRLLPVCPPLSESAMERRLLYYRARRVRAMHHAAPYAATRWTNIFDIGNLITTGDPFSGALRQNFGAGIEEHRVELRHPRWGRIFTHTQYWSLESTGREVLPDGTEGARSHLEVLRSAIDLRRVQENGPAAS